MIVILVIFLNQSVTQYLNTVTSPVQIGNDLSVVVTLELMSEMDFKNEELLYGIIDAGGIETILNIVEIENFSCQVGYFHK